MRRLIAACGLLAGAFVVVAQSPTVHVRAQEQPVAEKLERQPQEQTSQGKPGSASAASFANVDSAKQADIRQLMDVTGASDLGRQIMSAGIAQFRDSVIESQPDNPRAKQFADAFAVRFEKHFDPRSLTDIVLPIYDQHLSSEDVKELLAYYRSPFGQRMLKVLPDVARESQAAGFKLGQKAAQRAMEDLKAEYPEFMPDSNDQEKHPATN